MTRTLLGQRFFRGAVERFETLVGFFAFAVIEQESMGLFIVRLVRVVCTVVAHGRLRGGITGGSWLDEGDLLLLDKFRAPLFVATWRSWYSPEPQLADVRNRVLEFVQVDQLFRLLSGRVRGHGDVRWTVLALLFALSRGVGVGRHALDGDRKAHFEAGEDGLG